MSIESEQLVYDYLGRVGDLAQRAMPAAERLRLVTQLRAEIEQARAAERGNNPTAVRRILDRFGTPASVVERAAGQLPGEELPGERHADGPPPGGRLPGDRAPDGRPEGGRRSRTASPAAPPFPTPDLADDPATPDPAGPGSGSGAAGPEAPWPAMPEHDGPWDGPWPAKAGAAAPEPGEPPPTVDSPTMPWPEMSGPEMAGPEMRGPGMSGRGMSKPGPAESGPPPGEAPTGPAAGLGALWRGARGRGERSRAAREQRTEEQGAQARAEEQRAAGGAAAGGMSREGYEPDYYQRVAPPPFPGSEGSGSEGFGSAGSGSAGFDFDRGAPSEGGFAGTGMVFEPDPDWWRQARRAAERDGEGPEGTWPAEDQDLDAGETEVLPEPEPVMVRRHWWSQPVPMMPADGPFADAQPGDVEPMAQPPRRRGLLGRGGRSGGPGLLLFWREWLAVLLLVGGAVTGYYIVVFAGWLLAYYSARLSRMEAQWAALGFPFLAVVGTGVWLWGRADGRWGAPLKDGAAGSTLVDALPVVIRAAAVCSAVYLVWRANRRSRLG